MAWQTGQLTISAEDEEDEEEALCSPATECREEVEEEEVAVAVAVLCRIAGDVVITVSLDAAESPPNVFVKKSKMVAELLRSSHGLFLDGGPPPAAPDALPPFV